MGLRTRNKQSVLPSAASAPNSPTSPSSQKATNTSPRKTTPKSGTTTTATTTATTSIQKISCLIISIVILLLLGIFISSSFSFDRQPIGVLQDSFANLDDDGNESNDDGNELLNNYEDGTKDGGITKILTVPLILDEKLSSSSTSTQQQKVSSATLKQKVPYGTVRQSHINEIHNGITSSKLQNPNPLLLKGWGEHNIAKNKKFIHEMKYENFIQRFGNYTQYVKNEFVQIMKDDKNVDCISPSSSMVRLMKTSETNLLFFTNNYESPLFLDALRDLYTLPDLLDWSSTNANTKSSSSSNESFHVFSAMVKGSYHGFHNHDDAHIYQVRIL